MLLQIGDVGPMPKQKPRDRGHDPRPVGTGDEEPGFPFHALYYRGRGVKTAELLDLYPELPVAEPISRNFGGKRAFHGQIRTLRVFEDNALVRKTLEQEGRGQVLGVNGGGSLRTALLGGNLARMVHENG